MFGTARKCQHCAEAFTFRSSSSILISAVGYYLFLVDFQNHVKACAAKLSHLNDAGLYYLGMISKVPA